MSENDPTLVKGNEVLTTKRGVVDLMTSSKNEREWTANCDLVKAANGGDYPKFWFNAVEVTGIFNKLEKSWTK